MVRHARLRLFPVSSFKTALYLGLVAGFCFSAALALPVRASAAGPGPVAAYSFDEGEGTTVEDLTGDGNTATVEGAEWTPHGHYGGAMGFDGEGCVSVPSSPDLELREEMTVEAWIRPEGTGEAESIVFKESEHFFGYALFLGLQASGKVEGLVAEGAEYAPYVVSPRKIPDGVWTHPRRPHL